MHVGVYGEEFRTECVLLTLFCLHACLNNPKENLKTWEVRIRLRRWRASKSMEVKLIDIPGQDSEEVAPRQQVLASTLLVLLGQACARTKYGYCAWALTLHGNPGITRISLARASLPERDCSEIAVLVPIKTKRANTQTLYYLPLPLSPERNSHFYALAVHCICMRFPEQEPRVPPNSPSRQTASTPQGGFRGYFGVSFLNPKVPGRFTHTNKISFACTAPVGATSV